MKLATANHKGRAGAPRRPDAVALRSCPVSAFTLAEVLAAMLFLAIVIPVAVEALHVSSLAGEVAARKGTAARIADRILNESIVLTNWTGNLQNGTISEGGLDYKWSLAVQDWPQAGSQMATPPGGTQIRMQMVSAEVGFLAQGRDYSVTLSTLANYPNQSGATTLSMR
ncbi:MAG TPA: hypothetical protein VFY06_04245 [Verrucomicrobiae bacterium]|nr:hypothetical protein [Verrucomicrobiae bacterium]